MRTWKVTFIAICVLLIAFVSAQTYYPIDYTAASASPSVVVTSNTDIGTCVCDLTANECDPDCCCDPNCSAAQKLLFSACKPEGPSSATTVLTCAALAQVNANLTAATVSSLVGGGLCVTRVNSTRYRFSCNSVRSSCRRSVGRSVLPSTNRCYRSSGKCF